MGENMDPEELVELVSVFMSRNKMSVAFPILSREVIDCQLASISAEGDLGIVLEKLGRGESYRIMVDLFTFDEVPSDVCAEFVGVLLVSRAQVRVWGRWIKFVELSLLVGGSVWRETRRLKDGLRPWELALRAPGDSGHGTR